MLFLIFLCGVIANKYKIRYNKKHVIEKRKNMSDKIIKTICFILIFVTFGVIFKFSSQDGGTSSKLSYRIRDFILKFDKEYSNLSDKEKKERANKLHVIVRKMAHFSIYTVLGIILSTFFGIFINKNGKRSVICLAIGVLYAISDEIHQIFVPGRTAKVMDVFIDTSGVIIGIVIVIIIEWTMRKIVDKVKKQSKVLE